MGISSHRSFLNYFRNSIDVNVLDVLSTVALKTTFSAFVPERLNLEVIVNNFLSTDTAVGVCFCLY